MGCREHNILEQVHSDRLNWYYYFPLIFSLFYFFPLVLGRLDLYEMVVSIVAYGIFIALYTLCRVRERYAHWYIVGMAVLAIGLSGINSASYALLWFAVYFVAYLYSPVRALMSADAMLAALLWAAHMHGYPMDMYALVAGLPSVGLFFYGIFDRRIKREEAEKRARNKQIEQLAVIAERERLARDMHDVLGHSLTAINLKAQLAAKIGAGGDLEKAAREIEEVATLASSALTDVREVISQYKRKGFSAQLETLVAQLEAAGFSVRTRLAPLDVDAKRESQLILVLTEAVTNILRHSRGNQVEIELARQGDRYELRVHDNGNAGEFTSGNGLKGIQARVSEMEGKFHIDQQQGFGLQIQWQ